MKSLKSERESLVYIFAVCIVCLSDPENVPLSLLSDFPATICHSPITASLPLERFGAVQIPQQILCVSRGVVGQGPYTIRFAAHSVRR
ncbi:hypothetical protein BDW66DRAFT_124050 [Aspergillus desertorum]